MALFRKTSPRRNQVRRSIASERSLKFPRLADADIVVSLLLWAAFAVLSAGILSFGLTQQARYRALAALCVVCVLLAIGAAFYIGHYERRLIRNHVRAAALVALFVLLVGAAKLGVLSGGDALWAPAWGTGTAVLVAIVLVIAYDQRFALGMAAL